MSTQQVSCRCTQLVSVGLHCPGAEPCWHFGRLRHCISELWTDAFNRRQSKACSGAPAERHAVLHLVCCTRSRAISEDAHTQSTSGVPAIAAPQGVIQLADLKARVARRHRRYARPHDDRHAVAWDTRKLPHLHLRQCMYRALRPAIETARVRNMRRLLARRAPT